MCIFPSIFNIKMAAQKFTNFDKFFNMHADMTAVTQYNLSKLLWMKLQTTKHYYTHCTEKTDEFFDQPI